MQALYLRAEGGQIPELKRVIVAYKGQVVMGETLDDALANLFGGAAESPATPSAETAPAAARGPGAALPANARELIRQASEHYDRAIAAQRSGDWSTYGSEMRQVGELLGRLRGSTGGTP